MAQALVDILLQPLNSSVAGGNEGDWYRCKILESLLAGLLGDCPQASWNMLESLNASRVRHSCHVL